LAITALELLQTRHPSGCPGHWPSDSLALQLIAQQDSLSSTARTTASTRGGTRLLRTLSFAREVGRKVRQQNLALPISLRAVPHARGMRQRRASLAG
jgi:hypothetical protein